MAISGFKEQIVDLLFPRYCLNCHQEGEWLCEKCLATSPSRERQFILPVGSNFIKVKALFDYEQPLIDRIIAALKYNFAFDLSRTVHQLINKEKISVQTDDLPTVLVPVPLHRHRYLWRGFNQAEVIARALAATNSSLSVCPDLLRRVIYHKPQVGQTQESRERNVIGAFQVNLDCLSDNWGKRIILVDDVLTTGSTLRECAAILKTAGFAEISGFVLAA
jgi:ComF family protein